MQNARMTPEQARQYTLHSLEATMLSMTKQVDVQEHHRDEQRHRRKHGGRTGSPPQPRRSVGSVGMPAICYSESGRRISTICKSPWQSPQSRSTRSSPRWMWYPITLQLADLTDKSHGGARRSLPQTWTCIKTVVREGGAHGFLCYSARVINSRRRTARATSARSIFVLDERPHRCRARGGPCSSRVRQFGMNGIRP